jgi:hypothetical protein
MYEWHISLPARPQANVHLLERELSDLAGVAEHYHLLASRPCFYHAGEPDRSFRERSCRSLHSTNSVDNTTYSA